MWGMAGHPGIVTVGAIAPLGSVSGRRSTVLEQRYEEASASARVEGEKDPSESIEYPIVRKRFRVTIDVEATLAAGPRGGELPPAPESVPHTRALMELLRAQPELVNGLLRSRAVEAVKQAGKALEIEHRQSGTSEHELLKQISAALDPDARAYFTEEMEDGASEYYFDGYGATVERVVITEVEEE
jgi:hypothetical protein